MREDLLTRLQQLPGEGVRVYGTEEIAHQARRVGEESHVLPDGFYYLEFAALRQRLLQERLQAPAELPGRRAPDVPGV